MNIKLGLRSLIHFVLILVAVIVHGVAFAAASWYDTGRHLGPVTDPVQACIVELGADNFAGLAYVRGDGFDCYCYSNPGPRCAGVDGLCPIGYKSSISDQTHYHPGYPYALAFSNGAACVPAGTVPGKNMGQPSCPASVLNPINAATGNKYQLEIDYDGSAPASLAFHRHYNSASSLPKSTLGGRWTSIVDQRIDST